MAKQYYSERNGLLATELKLEEDELRSYYFKIYNYFRKIGYFKAAFEGEYIRERYSDKETLVCSPLMVPSPEVFFVTKLQSKEIWPINYNYENYDDATLFSVIEIMYDYIGKWDFDKGELLTEDPRKEYAEQVNNILKAYKEGYYLEPSQGFVMECPTIALQELLKYDGKEMEESVYEQLRTAAELYIVLILI